VDAFCERYPKLMHMTDASAWESICKYGLLSTEAIADQLKLEGPERSRILSEHRKTAVPLPGFIIRDQGPMNANLNHWLDPLD
jgi:hypothetical protein